MVFNCAFTVENTVNEEILVAKTPSNNSKYALNSSHRQLKATEHVEAAEMNCAWFVSSKQWRG